MNRHSAANIEHDRTTLGELPRAVLGGLAAAGLVLLAVGAGLGWGGEGGMTRFMSPYLVNYCFFLSISLGALFFVAIQHAARSGWSVAVRRPAEVLAGNMPLLAILFLPILAPLVLGRSGLYSWADAEVVARSDLIQWKAAYLNVPFFACRAVFYFAVWIAIARFYLGHSVRQDSSGDPELTRRQEKFSGPLLVVLALTVTFASFDWLMSLEPEWFSTIFGLYFFAGAIVAFFAALILAVLALQQFGCLAGAITTEHYHELGKLMFGFIIFWGYMAFSQYMLIWYANIPEESVWYLARQTGPWTAVSLVLWFGHLLIPFLGLMSREVKRRKALLGIWAVWMLAIHWVDLYWLVMPTFAPDSLPFGLADVACFVGLGCLFLAGLLRLAAKESLIPLRDPRLRESLAFENF